MAAHLVSVGTFAASGTAWPIFLSYEPDAGVDDVATVYDTLGLEDGRLMSGKHIVHPGVMLRVRSKEYSAGWSKLSAACDALATITYTNNLLLANVSLQGTKMFIGVDGTRRRSLFVANFQLTLKETP